jgi:hypothetical protein
MIEMAGLPREGNAAFFVCLREPGCQRLTASLWSGKSAAKEVKNTRKKPDISKKTETVGFF